MNACTVQKYFPVVVGEAVLDGADKEHSTSNKFLALPFNRLSIPRDFFASLRMAEFVEQEWN
jgi:hypothetical protein